MPNGPRIRANNVYGVIGDNPLTAAASTFTSVSLPLLPVVSAAHAVVVLDPKRVYGDPEIVVVIVHTAASTVATILRGQYGTSARIHPQGTAWAHVPIDEDFTEIVTSTTRPTDPYIGQIIYERDTNRFLSRNSTNTAWERQAWTSASGRTGVSVTTSGQNIPDAVETAISWTSKTFDSDEFITVPGTTFTIPSGLGGLYTITARLKLPATPSISSYQFINVASLPHLSSGGGVAREWFLLTICLPITEGSTLSYTIFQDHTGAQVTSSGEFHLYRIGP